MTTTTDQLPPHSLSDERSLLGCIIQNAQEALPSCSEIADDCFYDQFHKIVWKGIQALLQADSAINAVTLGRWVEQNEKVEGGMGMIIGLSGDAPTAFAVQDFVKPVLDIALRRKMIKACSRVTRLAMENPDVTELISTVQRVLDLKVPGSCQIVGGKESARRLLDDLERRHQLQGNLSGVDTGLYDLNKMLEGLQQGEQTLIGARPSIGKTAIGIGIFQHVVFNLGIPALFVSLEMSAESLMRRMMSSRSGVDMGSIRRGSYDEGEFKKFNAFISQSHSSKLHILDGVRGMGIGELCASVRRHVAKFGIKLVVVDYLQKIRPGERHEKRTYEVADVSGKLRALAVETGAAFLTLAQLNRESEKDKPRTPRLSDLADSGQIERDADTILLLHRDRADQTGKAMLIVAKQRDGETGLVPLHFNGPLCRFENANKYE